MKKLRPTRIIRHWLFWTGIAFYTLIPGSSYILVALATLKLNLDFFGRSARRFRRWLRIIYTSPPKVLFVCVLDFILTNAAIVTILITILNHLNL